MHSSRIVLPRKFRVRLALMRTLRWDFPVEPCLTLPVAVKRKRFLVALCVLSLLWVMINYRQLAIVGFDFTRFVRSGQFGQKLPDTEF